ncbi:hypothetical protein PoB_002551100 [Plakobranchus ocellatus]|uniref:Uncharacterized protein n=1 Tax=Plakobranchus ocellatus TaxID=259542 RepID=A0AAV3ZIR1_9GAST|nr:hypothetical protein PoB_002551100 [Plakobranchus ocellatus]
MIRIEHTLCIFLILAQTRAHVRFVCPRPTSPESNLESSSITNTVCPLKEGSTITDVEPGLFTVRFEETRFMKGAPFRILLVDNREVSPDVSNSTNTASLDEEGDPLSCLLLDHIPHNDHAIISDTCMKKGNEYPLGVCEESSYYITIRIPDVTCEDCSLVLQQIDVLPDHAVCDLNQRNGSTSNCFIFSSCARVRIRATEAGQGSDLRACGNYLQNIPGDWPYRPQDLYKTSHGAGLTMDLLHSNLHIDIPKDVTMGSVEKVEILQGGAVVWHSQVDEEQGNADAYLLTWKTLNKSQLHALRAGKYVLNVVRGKKATGADIIYLDQHFSEGRMSSLHDVYSHQGWLISSKFLGRQVEDPLAAFPAGRCAPRAHHYVAYLHSVHITAHGILGLTVMENRAYITAVLHEDNEVMQTIRIMPPDLVKLPKILIDVPQSFNGLVQAAIDISDHIPHLETERFLKSVEIKTDKEDAVLIGDLEEGMYAVLRDESGTVQGMGALQFTQGQAVRLEIVVKDLSPTIEAVHLYGLGKQPADISRNTIRCTHKFCCLEARLTDPSSELVLSLVKGQAVLHVDTGARNVSGQVIVPTQRYCEMMDGQCETDNMEFSLFGVGVDHKDNSKGGLEEDMGLIQTGTFALDRANILMYCLEFENVAIGNQSLEASLTVGNQPIDSMTLQLDPSLSNSYFGCSKIPLRTDAAVLPSLTGLGKEKVMLTVKRGGEKMMYQEVPHVHRSNCTHTVIHEVGKTRAQWSINSTPLADIYAVVLDILHFVFRANTSVYLANNKAAFENCNFEEAREITKVTSVYNMYSYFFHIKEAGTRYFMDKESCNTSTPLKLVVRITDPENVVDTASHSRWCKRSAYSVWRARLTHTWGSPNVSGPIIIGLVLGLVCSVAFLIWQGVRLRIIPDRFQGRHESLF